MTLERRRAASAAVLALVVTIVLASATSGCGGPAPASLARLAAQRHLLLGAAVGVGPLAHDAGYRRVLARDFNAVTPENAMKWKFVHPQPDRYDFRGGDRIVDFARAHGMLVRGHTLAWYNQLAPWVTSGHYPRARLVAILRDHIFKVVGHYRGRVAQWDVVNEAFNDDGSLRHNVFLDTIGPEYIALAFRWAHQADPAAKLYLNDFGAEGSGPKSDAIYALVKRLRGRGVPIDGVGLQAHLTLSPVPGVRANMERLAALGVGVAVTELDVRLSIPATVPEFAAQAALYGLMLRDCLAVPACRTFVVWGVTDRYSWIPGSFSGYGAADLLSDDLAPKPAYEAVAKTLRG